FDYDPHSVACTAALKRQHFRDDPAWGVYQGSVLDEDFLAGLGTFDVVYSWGVLHHTGALWQALANVAPRVGADGLLFLSLYNDQGPASRHWLRVKRLYNRLPRLGRPLLLLPAFAYLYGGEVLRDTMKG